MKFKTIAAGLAAAVVSTVLAPVAVSAPAQAQSQTSWYVNDEPVLWGPQNTWYWGDSGHGYGANNYRYTYAIGGESSADNWVHWYMGNRVGRQEIQVYVPSNHATATVNYNITIGSSTSKRAVAQRNISGWHSLGNWNVNGADVVIAIFDNDAEQHWERNGLTWSSIGVDAIRMRCVSNCGSSQSPPPPPPPPTDREVTISLGPDDSGPHCLYSELSCRWVNITMRNFASGSYDIDCSFLHSESGEVRRPISGSITHHGESTAALNRFCSFNVRPGRSVWVTIDGVRSNVLSFTGDPAGGSSPPLPSDTGPPGSSPGPSSIESSTLQEAPGRVVSAGHGTILFGPILHWQRVAGATHYEIDAWEQPIDQSEVRSNFRCDSASPTCVYLYRTDGLVFRRDSTTSQQFRDAPAFRVRGYNEAGYGEWSEWVTIQIGHVTGIETQVNMLPSFPDLAQTYARWKPVPGAREYEVAMYQDNNSSFSQTTNCCSLRIDDLYTGRPRPGIRVRALGEDEVGPWSELSYGSDTYTPFVGLRYAGTGVSWNEREDTKFYDLEWKYSADLNDHSGGPDSGVEIGIACCSFPLERKFNSAIEVRIRRNNQLFVGQWSKWAKVINDKKVHNVDYSIGPYTVSTWYAFTKDTISWDPVPGATSYGRAWQYRIPTDTVRSGRIVRTSSLDYSGRSEDIDVRCTENRCETTFLRSAGFRAFKVGVFAKKHSEETDETWIGEFEAPRCPSTSDPNRFEVDNGRVRAIHSFRIRTHERIARGQEGGKVASGESLAQKSCAWVLRDAEVTDGARVYGNAIVSGNARVKDTARVYENATVSGEASIGAFVQVYGDAQVYGSAEIENGVHVAENARVYGESHIDGDENAGWFSSILDSKSILIGGEAIIDGARVTNRRGSGNRIQIGGTARLVKGMEIDGRNCEAELIEYDRVCVFDGEQEFERAAKDLYRVLSAEFVSRYRECYDVDYATALGEVNLVLKRMFGHRNVDTAMAAQAEFDKFRCDAFLTIRNLMAEYANMAAWTLLLNVVVAAGQVASIGTFGLSLAKLAQGGVDIYDIYATGISVGSARERLDLALAGVIPD